MDFTLIFGYPLGWVMWLLYQVVKNYGVAILLFTLFIRVLLFPLGIKQQKSTAKMALFQPKIAALQKKYKNNKQKLQEETMKLYEEEGYNPMSGCLPLLIQLPILFGLINVIYNPLTHMLRISNELIASATEIMQNLTTEFTLVAASPQISIINAVKADPAAFSALGSDFVNSVQSFQLDFLGCNLGSVAPFAWDWLILVPILSGVTSVLAMFISMKFNYAKNAEGAKQANGMSKGMMFIMPLFSLFFAFQVPVGVVIYWIMSNVLMALQSFILFKIYTPEKMEKLLEEDKKKKKKKNSRFQQALKNAQDGKRPDLIEDDDGMVTYKGQIITKKEANRLRLAEARRRDAEKYGEEYKEVTDDDLR